jgi:hypothetical protein
MVAAACGFSTCFAFFEPGERIGPSKRAEMSVASPYRTDDDSLMDCPSITDQ